MVAIESQQLPLKIWGSKAMQALLLEGARFHFSTVTHQIKTASIGFLISTDPVSRSEYSINTHNKKLSEKKPEREWC